MDAEVNTGFFEQSLKLLAGESKAEVLLAISKALWPALKHDFGKGVNVPSFLSALITLISCNTRLGEIPDHGKPGAHRHDLAVAAYYMRFAQAIYGRLEYTYSRLFGLHPAETGGPSEPELKEDEEEEVLTPPSAPQEVAAKATARMAAKEEEAAADNVQGPETSETAATGAEQEDVTTEVEASGRKGEELHEGETEDEFDWEMPTYDPAAAKKVGVRGAAARNFCTRLDLKSEDLRYLSDGANIHIPRFAVALDHRMKAVVLVIRGSMEIADFLTDLDAKHIAFMNGYAHGGIARSARRIYEKALLVLAQACKDFPAYDVVVTGHSLGGGVALTLSLLLNMRMTEAGNRPRATNLSHSASASSLQQSPSPSDGGSPSRASSVFVGGATPTPDATMEVSPATGAPAFPLPHWHAGFDQQLDIDGSAEMHYNEAILQPLLWRRRVICHAFAPPPVFTQTPLPQSIYTRLHSYVHGWDGVPRLSFDSVRHLVQLLLRIQKVKREKAGNYITSLFTHHHDHVMEAIRQHEMERVDPTLILPGRIFFFQDPRAFSTTTDLVATPEAITAGAPWYARMWSSMTDGVGLVTSKFTRELRDIYLRPWSASTVQPTIAGGRPMASSTAAATHSACGPGGPRGSARAAAAPAKEPAKGHEKQQESKERKEESKKPPSLPEVEDLRSWEKKISKAIPGIDASIVDIRRCWREVSCWELMTLSPCVRVEFASHHVPMKYAEALRDLHTCALVQAMQP